MLQRKKLLKLEEVIFFHKTFANPLEKKNATS